MKYKHLIISLLISIFLNILLVKNTFSQNKKTKNTSKNTTQEKKEPKLNIPKTIIVIDAGHGGEDPGKPKGKAIYKHEKDINLAIALKLGKYITQNIPNAEVYQVRTTDRTVSLADRMDFANGKKADLFISIHCNSNPNAQVNGTEIHVYGAPLDASVKLAEIMKKEFSEKLKRKFRGIVDNAERGHNLYVLQYADMPSVLVECGYMSNPEEEKFLNNDKSQNLMASAIYRGIKSYLQIPNIREKEKQKAVFKVQLMATEKPLPAESKRFEELEEKVEIIETDGKYRYKYLIGHEYSQERAEELAKKVSKLGFKGAFVVQVE
jgi:N-acetylmuramoyl-L-alanine amidase